MAGTGPNSDSNSFDAVVIGTGFGGAVAACRLVQAGRRICLLERGRRYESQSPRQYRRRPPSRRSTNSRPDWSDFPRLPDAKQVLPDPRRWAWPKDQGLWDVRNLGDIVTVQAAGYGGGSLIYANVHLRAPEEVFSGWPFSRAALDPYYDLVAFMLDVKPITQAPFARPALPVKTQQLEKVARELGRASDFFYPPLTVNFDGGPAGGRRGGYRVNRFGRAQSPCDGCGECCTGCRQRAKNSLDLNYLAVVDDSDLAEVRTQAEARLIFAERSGYRVQYRDHLRGRERCEVRAESVFVCAGAVNSTELLLRSREAKGLPDLEGKVLGKSYFPNADAIGMVYDAKTPRRKPRLLSPTEGPTITASICCREPRAGPSPEQWFLLEEGGFPLELARHIGLLRSPVLLRRNRHDDRDLCRGVIRPVKGKRSKPAGLQGPAAPQTELLRSLAAGLYKLLREEPETFLKISPKQLHSALETLNEREFEPFLARQLESLFAEVKRELLEIGSYRLLKLCPCLISKSAAVKATRRAIRRKYGLGAGADAKERLEGASEVVRWLARFDDNQGSHSQNCMVLLVMGRDAKPGTIVLKDRTLQQEEVENCEKKDEAARSPKRNEVESDGLEKRELYVDLCGETRIYTVQECLMRDVACALGGKLRQNPLWSFARTPVTVHSQGGCPMSSDPSEGVTDPWGQVHGYPGLFVMDAAAFPTAVGVNPSATIAAVAERNMARYLGPPAADMRRARQWWSQQSWKSHRRVRLEPPQGPAVKPVNQPVGIRWEEEMSGFHSATRPPADDTDYEIAEAKGREQHETVSVALKATVDDVAAVIHSRKHAVRMEGMATVTWKSESIANAKLQVSGTLTLPESRGEVPEEGRMMRLALDSDCGQYSLTGYKRIRDDPGPDAWRDTATLFMTLKNLATGKESYGVIRLSLDAFLFRQLPTFRVTNTDDPARITWALSSFAAYFFGALQQVYVPQLGRVLDRFTGLGIR